MQLELYKARKTILLYLKRAGFHTIEYDHVTPGEMDILCALNEITIQVKHTTEDAVVLVVFQTDTTAFTKTSLQKIVGTYFEPQSNQPTVLRPEKDRLVLVSMHAISESVASAVAHYYDDRHPGVRFHVTVFSLPQLQFDIFSITNLVPPTYLLDDEQERQTVLDQFHVSSLDQLPTIARDDPVAKSMFLKVGQMIKIVRPSLSAGTTLYYRICN
jgi:DNA-directed RNA polymerase subunit H (RpoH/RPB5)